MANAVKKHAWLKFYPQDWRGDAKLRSCSIGARGLWVEMLCIMHEAEPYGHLLLGNVPVSNKQLAALAGINAKETLAYLLELGTAGVFSRTSEGVIFSRRMVRDHERSLKGREDAGKRWGNGKPNADPNGVPTSDPITPDARSQIDRIGSARASAFTEGSKALASAFWKALGFERSLDIPPEFAGVDWRALEWEAAGWSVDMITAEAKRIGPAKPLSYHEKVFATAHAKLHAPLPKVEIREAETVQVTHGKSQVRPGVAEIARRYAEHFEGQSGDSIEGGAGAFLRLSRQ